MVYDLCKHSRKPYGLFSANFFDAQSSLEQWLVRYFFSQLISGSRPLNSAFISKCMEDQPAEFSDINMLVKEWIEEAAVITRILEMLLVIEPMIDVHEIELFSYYNKIWSIMFRGDNIRTHCDMVAKRCQTAKWDVEEPRDYRLPHTSQRQDEIWEEKYLAAKICLRDTWEAYFDSIRDWVDGYKSCRRHEMVELFDKVEAMTEPPAISLPERKVRGVPLGRNKVRPVEPFTESIPHHSGPETPSRRKVTKRKLADEAKLIADSRDEDKDQVQLGEPEEVIAEEAIEDPVAAAGEELVVEAEVAEQDEPEEPTIQIPIKRRYMPLIGSLYSNAQAEVASVRWPRFERFMEDAGCTVRYTDNAVTFSGHNVVTGQRTACVIHKPHPDTTLYAVHLRNNRLHIEAAFGWKEEMFVEKQGAAQTEPRQLANREGTSEYICSNANHLLASNRDQT